MNNFKKTISFSISGANQTVWSYRAKVTVGDCSTIEYTEPVTITVLKSVVGTIAGAGAICSGDSKLLTLAISSGTVQWQVSEDGEDFIDIDEAIGNSYSASPTTDTYYRVKVTNSNCTPVYSKPVKITVNSQVDAGTISEGDFSVCFGATSSLHLQDNTNKNIRKM